MKMTTKKLSWLGLFGMIVFVGCGSNPEKQILGKWQSESGKTVVEFLKDGSYIEDNSKIGMSVTAKWRFLDKERIEIANPLLSIIRQVKIEGDTLILTGKSFNGVAVTEKYRRL